MIDPAWTPPEPERPVLALDALTPGDVETARLWRNDESARLGLRTPYLLTAEMQRRFYDEVVCNRNSPHRYYAIRQAGEKYRGEEKPAAFVAMGGLTDCDWVNGHAEISLIVDPARQGQGVGGAAVGLLLAEAFGQMRLVTVIAEVYTNNPAVGFWGNLAQRHGALTTTLPRRKWWDGRLWDSLLVTFTAEAWRDA